MPGIIPRSLAELLAFATSLRGTAECRVTMSYLELYNEELIDLLAMEQPSGGLVVRKSSFPCPTALSPYLPISLVLLSRILRRLKPRPARSPAVDPGRDR